MTGVDRATGMLEIATEKATAHDVDIALHHGDMRDFQLNQRFDAILCTYDSINYAHDETELHNVF